MEYLNAFLCRGFIRTLTRMHKLHQTSLPLYPAGIVLKACCNSEGSFKLFVCIRIDLSGEEILYLVPRSVL